MFGYAWWVKYADGFYQPEERSYRTLDEIYERIAHYGYPIQCCEIERVFDHNGVDGNYDFDCLETIRKAKEVFYIDKEY